MADAPTSGGGGQQRSIFDRTAEDFPVVKKYRRDDGSDFPMVIGKPLDVESHSPIEEEDWDSVFQMCEIKVLELGGKDSAEIYGKIYFHYQYGTWKLYNREKEDAETIDLPGVITLTPPIFGIMPFDRLFMSFDMAGGLEGMNKKTVGWMPHLPHDEVRTITANGWGWAMEVSYIAFDSAVLADMEIDLLNLENDEKIYGSITASYTEDMSCVAPLFMFNKKPSDSVRVTEQEPIQLSRPFIAVPYYSALNINVNLHTLSCASIACGTISIWPESFGKWFGILGGKHGEIQVRVKVDFSPDHKHNGTAYSREAGH